MLFDIDAMTAKVAKKDGWLLAIPAIVAIPATAIPNGIATIASVATIANSHGVKNEISNEPIATFRDSVEMRIESNGGDQLSESSNTWRLVFQDGSNNELICSPPASRGEIVERYKPYGLLRADIAQGCTRCIHYSGHFKYCGSPDRTDLTRVYSENHPLKELPLDRGACCDVFVDSDRS